jgi:hypothetical protein
MQKGSEFVSQLHARGSRSFGCGGVSNQETKRGEEGRKMKVLFLDIDGVLNSTQGVEWHRLQRKIKGCIWIDHEFFCPIAVNNLKLIMRKLPHLKIVISSSWRECHVFDELKKLLHDYCDIEPSRIIGKTPRLYDEQRGTEIQKWLDDNGAEHGVTHFVILDDNDDMVHLKPCLVQTNGDHGFMWADAIKVLKQLGCDERLM